MFHTKNLIKAILKRSHNISWAYVPMYDYKYGLTQVYPESFEISVEIN